MRELVILRTSLRVDGPYEWAHAVELGLAQGITPVISPTARGEDGKIYNCNADVAAAQAAIALKAKRLVFLSDVPGLMRDPKDPATLETHKEGFGKFHRGNLKAMKRALGLA